MTSMESESSSHDASRTTQQVSRGWKISSPRTNESVVNVLVDRYDEGMTMETIPDVLSFEIEPMIAQHRRRALCCGGPWLSLARGTASRVSGLLGVGLTLLLSALLLLTLSTNRLPYQQPTWHRSNLSSDFQRPKCLSFRNRSSGSSTNEFKILQITDIHLGEAPDRDWGPIQDLDTWKALDAVIRAEAPIDLIVLSGDQLTANDCKDNATVYYQQLGDFLTPYGIPWALIFGNHDDADYEARNGQRFPPRYVREDLLAIDQGFSLSLTQAGPESIDGTTNYMLDIYRPYVGRSPFFGCQSRSSVAAQILLLDSGGGTIEKAITDSQIEWVRGKIQQSTVPAVAFQHIPTKSHAFVGENVCQGLHDDGLDALDYDGGIMETLSESERFFFLAVGHNHGNDYCCRYNNSFHTDSMLHVCFGRHSGHGGYGKWDRGCRVYMLEYDDPDETSHPSLAVETASPSSSSSSAAGISSTSKMQWSSWVRLESGEVIDRIDV